jgi:hypothetical protein
MSPRLCTVFANLSSPEKKDMQKKLASSKECQKTKEKHSRHQQRQHAADALLDLSIQEGVTVEPAIEEVPINITSPDICTEVTKIHRQHSLVWI